jgi:probable HAF family extracellular repeat protein
MPFQSDRLLARDQPRAAASWPFAIVAFGLGVLATRAHARAAGPAPAPSFTAIGDLPGGATSSSAVAVSADGSVVVGASSSANGSEEAVRWTRAGGPVGLGDLPGGAFYSEADGVSADGNVIVGSGGVAADLELRQAFRWTPSNGMVGLGYLPGAGAGATSAANEVSRDGNTVVGFSSSGIGLQAFRWTPGAGMVGLGELPGHERNTALGVSGDGDVVVGTSIAASTGLIRAFRWTPGGGMAGLDPLPDDAHSSARRVSADGRVVVGSSQTSTADRQAVRWVEGATTPLSLGPVSGLPGAPTPMNSDALAVSADGSVVVGTADSNAFIWDAAHGARDLKTVLARDYGLDLSGWRLIAAWDVSDDGSTIVGFGADPSSHTMGWVAVLPVPEPGGMSLAGSLGLLLLRRRSRRAVTTAEPRQDRPT